MHDELGALDGIDERCLVQKISLHELELIEKLAEGLSNGSNLGFVVLVSDRASDAIAAVLEEKFAYFGAHISSDTSQGDYWFVRFNHRLEDFIKDIFN